MLFFLIVMRMAGFVFLNPVLGRRNIPSQVKVGLSMVMAVLVYSTAVSQGTANEIETGSAVVFGVLAVKELLIGYFLGFVMQLFDMILTFAGTVIDFQLGISMAMVYDAQNGAQVALSGNILQIFYLLLFFVTDGHLALMKILALSGEIVPYGEVAISGGAAWLLLDIFVECVVLAMRMAFPMIAFEFLVQVGVGVLTKINPQVNLFVLSIQLRLTVGLILMMFLIGPIGDYIGNMITEMLNTLQGVLRILAG
jgi:flagellar biosynthetic protein FliR